MARPSQGKGSASGAGPGVPINPADFQRDDPESHGEHHLTPELIAAIAKLTGILSKMPGGLASAMKGGLDPFVQATAGRGFNGFRPSSPGSPTPTTSNPSSASASATSPTTTSQQIADYAAKQQIAAAAHAAKAQASVAAHEAKQAANVAAHAAKAQATAAAKAASQAKPNSPTPNQAGTSSPNSKKDARQADREAARKEAEAFRHYERLQASVAKAQSQRASEEAKEAKKLADFVARAHVKAQKYADDMAVQRSVQAKKYVQSQAKAHKSRPWTQMLKPRGAGPSARAAASRRQYAKGAGFRRAASSLSKTASFRAKAASRMARKAFAKTGSVKAAASAGMAGLGGRAGLALMASSAAGAVAGIVGLGVAAYHGVEKMRAFAEAVNAGNRGLSRYNGAIGNAFMELNMGDFRRNVDLARQTQGSTITLARVVDRMRDGFHEINIFQNEVQNRAAGFAGAFAGQIGQDFGKIVKPFREAIQANDPNGLVGQGVGAGLAAGLWQFGASAIMNPFNIAGALEAGQAAAGKAAAAAVDAAAKGRLGGNDWGIQLHRMAAPGPFLRRPTPRR